MEEKRFCAGCGHQLEEGAKFCTYCGRAVEGIGFNNSGNNTNDYSDYDNQGYSQQDNYQSNGISSSDTNGTLALVFGILSIVLGGILWAILAFVFASKAEPYSSRAKTGKILAVIGIVFWVIAIIALIFLSASLATQYK